MENHFHLVVTTELERLSKGMHTLGFRYAQAFNGRHARVGHLFQGRFGSRSVEGEEAGLCSRVGDYPWSGPTTSGCTPARRCGPDRSRLQWLTDGSVKSGGSSRDGND